MSKSGVRSPMPWFELRGRFAKEETLRMMQALAASTGLTVRIEGRWRRRLVVEGDSAAVDAYSRAYSGLGPASPATPATGGSRFGRKSAPVPKPRRSLMEWAALSLMTEHPKTTGDPAIDEWNHVVSCVQSYLNGKAIATADDDEKEYLLRLRADLNHMHLHAVGVEDAISKA